MLLAKRGAVPLGLGKIELVLGSWMEIQEVCSRLSLFGHHTVH